MKNIKMPDHHLVIKPESAEMNLLRMFQESDTSIDSELCEIFQAARVTLTESDANDSPLATIAVVKELRKEEFEKLGTLFVYEADDFLCPRCRRKVATAAGQPCDFCLNVLAAQYK